MKTVGTFLDMRRYSYWAHKIGSWKYLSEDLFCQFFPEYRMPHFCSPPRTPFRGCWKWAVAATHDLIVVAVSGKRPWQVPVCSWQHTFDKRLLAKIYNELLTYKKAKSLIKWWSKDLNRHVTKEDVYMASNYLKKCSTSCRQRNDIKRLNDI